MGEKWPRKSHAKAPNPAAGIRKVKYDCVKAK